MEGKLYKALSVTAIAVVLAAMAFGAGTAAEKEKTKVEACKSIKDETDCKAREDCSWVSASIDKKTGKEKRKAYCRSKPKTTKKTKKT